MLVRRQVGVAVLLAVVVTALAAVKPQQPQQSLQTPPPRPPPTPPQQRPQNDPLSEDALAGFYNGVEKFSLEMLKHLASAETNVAFSPLTTWVLLALLSEGASGTTLQELRNTLALPRSFDTLHLGFGQIRGDIKRSVGSGESDSTLEMGSAAFTSPFLPLKPEFERIAESYYNTSLEALDFRNTSGAAARINSWVSDLTRGQIPTIVQEGDLVNARMVLASALYFKGAWRDAFNETLTKTETFVDDEGRKVADVDMMHRVGKFRMSLIEKLGALALELPYASERNSMLLLMPRRGTNMAEMLDKIGNATLPLVASVMRQLHEDYVSDQDDEDIHVYLPRFNLHSKQRLPALLKAMGIRKLFRPEGPGELLGLSSQENLYVSELLHKASITVAEQGTVAAAASAAILHNYSLPSIFKANRPFLFLIVQKSTNTILFAGKVGNPNPEH